MPRPRSINKYLRAVLTGAALLLAQGASGQWTHPADISMMPLAHPGQIAVSLRPEIDALFGLYTDPLRTTGDLVPRATWTPIRGGVVTIENHITLWDDIGRHGNRWRPGIVSYAHRIEPSQRTVLVAATGLFSNERYGASLDGRAYTPGGAWSASFHLGLTGLFTRIDRTWIYSDPNRGTWTATLARFDRHLRHRLSLTAGRFVRGDHGARLRLERAFGPVILGLEGLLSSLDDNAGFTLRLFLPPYGNRRLGPVHVAQDHPFDWTYRYRGYKRSGETFGTGLTLDEATGWRDFERNAR